MSEDWFTINPDPMSKEVTTLWETVTKLNGLSEEFKDTKKDHEMRIRSIEKQIWMAVGVFSLVNCGLFLLALGIIFKYKP